MCRKHCKMNWFVEAKAVSSLEKTARKIDKLLLPLSKIKSCKEYAEKVNKILRNGTPKWMPCSIQWTYVKELDEFIKELEPTHGQNAHSPDYRSVRWNGKNYFFTSYKAACVKILWENWEKGTPDVGDTTVLETAGCESSRVLDVFKNHPNWTEMIVQGETKGTHRLSEPIKTEDSTQKKPIKKTSKKK